MTDAKETDQVFGDDRLRLVDVLLEEVCTESVGSAVLPAGRRRIEPLLAAALVLLGIGVLVGVTVLQRPVDVPAQDPVPVPVPFPVPPNLLQDIARRQVEVRRPPSRTHDLGLLAQWGPDLPAPARGPRLPGTERSGVVFDLRDPDELRPDVAGAELPAVVLLRDMLPANAYQSEVLRAEVADAAELADQPAQILSLYCRGGDGAVLAQAMPRFTGLKRLRLGELLDDDVANALAGASPLVELEAGCRGLTDVGLQALSRVRSLRTLVLWGDLSTLTGQSFSALKQIECLRIAAPMEPRPRRAPELGLLAHVLQMSQLRELQIVMHEPPPDAADGSSALLPPLRAMPTLRRLGVVTLSGSLASLVRGLPTLQLERLRLRGAALTEADVETMGSLQALVELDLADAHFVSPATANAALRRLANVRRLVLGFTNFSYEQITELQQALPDCVVYTDVLTGMPGGPQEILRSGSSARGNTGGR